MIGQGVRLQELATGAKWTPVSDPDTLIVHVVAPRPRKSRAEAAAAATAEPEVIKKGKPEDEKDDAKDKK